MAEECKVVYLDILNRQRQWLLLKNKSEMAIDEDIIRRHLYYLDLEEEKLRFV
jgi:CPA1 family monovalent cation:H+ antiporter